METLLRELWLNRSVPGARFDAHMDKISTYTPLTYSDECGSTGLITRIIELSRLREMQPLFNTFTENTGYTVGKSGCTEQELDIITLHAISLHAKINDDLNTLKVELSEYEQELGYIKSGKVEGIGSAIRDKARWVDDKKDRVTNAIIKAELWCFLIDSILTLLNNEIKEWEKGDYQRKHQLPKKVCNYQSEFDVKSISKEVNVFLSKLSEFEGAIKTINSYFIPSTDRYNKRHNPTQSLHIEAYKFYYGQSGELVRNTMSGHEYIEHTVKQMDSAVIRFREMMSDIDFNQANPISRKWDW